MNRPVKVLLSLVVLAALVAGGFFVFELFERHEIKGEAKKPCGPKDTPSGTTTIPASLGFTLPSSEHVNTIETQGKTVIVNASAAGGLDDIVKVRDDVLADLVSQGFTKAGTDQEKGIEAEASFKGKIAGSIKVKPLCQDRLLVRYTFRA